MQVPTCSNIRIRSTQDAHKIFHAIQRGLLYMVTRRLDADERSALGTGCVYAWEERGPHSEMSGLGIERFTEGRRWSPSRVRDEFLFYYEKFVPPPDLSTSQSEKLPPRDWDPLIKQTYSVWVDTDKGKRKWHLTAYFTQASVDRLGTVDDIPGIRKLIVPDGIFKSTRTGKNRNKQEEPGRSGDKLKQTTTGARVYAPFPSPTLYSVSHLNQSKSTPQQAHVLSSPYPEQFSYPQYYPTQAQSNHFSANSEIFNPMTRPQSHEDTQYSPSISASQVSYIHEASPKQIYVKAVDDSSHVPEPRTTQAPYTLAYVRVPSIAHSSEGPLLSSSYPRGYESFSYAVPNAMPTNPVDYMISLPQSMISSGKHPSFPHSNSEPYSETDAPQKSPNLPPLHSVEGIQGSAYTLTSPSEALIPGEGRRRTVGSNRDLAPLQSLARPCPYRREPLDDKTLRLLGPHD